MLLVPLPKALAQRAFFYPHIGNINQPQFTFWCQHHIPQVHGAEINPQNLHLVDKLPKALPDIFRTIAFSVTQLAQGEAGQGMVMHGITFNAGNAVHGNDFWAGNAELFELGGIVGKTLGVGPDGGRADQAFATEQFEKCAVGQNDDLVTMAVLLNYLAVIAQGQIVVVLKYLHVYPVLSGRAVYLN